MCVQVVCEAQMEPITQFAVLSAASMLAAALAFGLNWFFLQATFHLIQPAAATLGRKHNASKGLPIRSDLVTGTRAIAQQFGPHR